MRIYTKGGDAGETGLFGGARVGKNALRITAYGDVDELNSLLGWCAVAANGLTTEMLQREQGNLFTLGSYLATPPDALEEASRFLPPWQPEVIGHLEREIDQWHEELAPLKTFLLPGGTELAARLHLARTVCRRAERQLVALSTSGSEGAVAGGHLAYLNRLSDWLFMLARWANHQQGVADIPWNPDAKG